MRNLPFKQIHPAKIKPPRLWVARSKEGKTAIVVHNSRDEARELLLQHRSEFPANNKQLVMYYRPDKSEMAERLGAGHYEAPAPFEFGRCSIEDDPAMSGAGTVYLIHLERPYHHVQHYIGYTELPVADRLARHRRGQGSRLLRAVSEEGISYEVARTWDGKSRKFERWLKALRNSAKRCPVCCAEPEEGGILYRKGAS